MIIRIEYNMCDFMAYELKEMLRIKKTVEGPELEEEELEFEKAEERPITIRR